MTAPHTASNIFAAIAFPVLGLVEFSLVVAGNGRIGESGKPSNSFSLMLSLEDLVGLELIESGDDIERVVFRRGRIFADVVQVECRSRNVSRSRMSIIERRRACRMQEFQKLKTANPVGGTRIDKRTNGAALKAS